MHRSTKSVLTILVLALAAGTARAETTLYGRAHVGASVIFADDLQATPNVDYRSLQISSNNSRVGIRGSEDLGGGLAAIYQYEFGVELDAATTDTHDSIQMRNSFVGLSGSFGRFLLGQHDTPYKRIATKLDPFRDTLADANAILGREGGGSYFNSRFNNSITYQSPRTGPVRFAASYSADRDPKEDNLQTTGANDPNADNGFSVLGMYKGDRFGFGAAYESIDLNEGQSTLTGLRAFGKVSFGDRDDPAGGRIAVVYESLDLKDLGGGVWDPSHDNFYVSGTWRNDPWRLNGAFGLAGEVKDAGMGYDASESGATFYAAGVGRKLAPKTYAYLNYAAVSNGEEAHYGLGQVEDNCNHFLPANGQNANAASLGIIHKF